MHVADRILRRGRPHAPPPASTQFLGETYGVAQLPEAIATAAFSSDTTPRKQARLSLLRAAAPATARTNAIR